MTEEIMDANQEDAETSVNSSETENELDQNVSEDANTPDAKSLEDKYNELMEANRQLRDKNRKLQDDAKKIVPPKELVPKDGETDLTELAKARADAYIARMVATDPSFKDRVEKVEKYVKAGYNIDEADIRAKAELMDEVMSGERVVSLEKTNKPTKTETAATPEEETPKAPTLKNLMKDTSKEAMEMKKALEVFGA